MNLRGILVAVTSLLALALVVAAAALAAGGPPSPAGQGTAQPVGALTSIEREALVRLREEEKLARDVYAKLAALYPSNPIFGRIAGAEQAHMDAVGRLLARYGVADPAAGNGPGTFRSEELQRLYDELVARGAGSQAAALEVGTTVEKQDIADLQRYLGEIGNADVQRVFTNLVRASQSHLEAFTGGSLPAAARGQGAGNGPGLQQGPARGPQR